MDITVTFIGNATTLIAAGEITLLTDPNFLHAGQHAYLGYGLLSKRLHDPALDIDQLPALDAVVLSHMHGDHWDRVAQAQLDRALPILTTPHAAKRLVRRGFERADPMATWDTHTITKGTTTVTVTSLPGRHGPAPIHRVLPPVMGSMIEATSGEATRRLYVHDGRPSGCRPRRTAEAAARDPDSLQRLRGVRFAAFGLSRRDGATRPR